MAVSTRPVPRTAGASVAEPAATWVFPGAWREHGIHRATRQASRRAAFSQVVTRIRVRARTMATTARKIGWSVGWMAAFTGAGFTVNVTLGLVVLGFSALFMDLRTGE